MAKGQQPDFENMTPDEMKAFFQQQVGRVQEQAGKAVKNPVGWLKGLVFGGGGIAGLFGIAFLPTRVAGIALGLRRIPFVGGLFEEDGALGFVTQTAEKVMTFASRKAESAIDLAFEKLGVKGTDEQPIKIGPDKARTVVEAFNLLSNFGAVKQTLKIGIEASAKMAMSQVAEATEGVGFVNNAAQKASDQFLPKVLAMLDSPLAPAAILALIAMNVLKDEIVTSNPNLHDLYNSPIIKTVLEFVPGNLDQKVNDRLDNIKKGIPEQTQAYYDQNIFVNKGKQANPQQVAMGLAAVFNGDPHKFSVERAYELAVAYRNTGENNKKSNRYQVGGSAPDEANRDTNKLIKSINEVAQLLHEGPDYSGVKKEDRDQTTIDYLNFVFAKITNITNQYPTLEKAMIDLVEDARNIRPDMKKALLGALLKVGSDNVSHEHAVDRNDVEERMADDVIGKNIAVAGKSGEKTIGQATGKTVIGVHTRHFVDSSYADELARAN